MDTPRTAYRPADPFLQLLLDRHSVLVAVGLLVLRGPGGTGTGTGIISVQFGPAGFLPSAVGLGPACSVSTR